MKYLDEMTNEELQRHMRTSPWDDFAYELRRVNGVINSHALSGDNLTYWFERQKILNQHLGVS